MTNKQLIRTTCIVGGLIGAGILVYRFNKQSTKKSSKPLAIVPELKKAQPVVASICESPKQGKVSERQESPAPDLERQETGLEKENLSAESPFPLQKGSCSKEVERLQIWLLRNHGWRGTITGVFDSQTQALVQKSLQKDSVDQATYKKHKMSTPIYQQNKRK